MRVWVAPSWSSCSAHLAGEHPEFAGVDADRAERLAAGGHGIGHTGRHVVGVHQQRGVGAQRVDLGAEGGELPYFRGAARSRVQHGEGVRGGALGGIP